MFELVTEVEPHTRLVLKHIQFCDYKIFISDKPGRKHKVFEMNYAPYIYIYIVELEEDSLIMWNISKVEAVYFQDQISWMPGFINYKMKQ